MQLYAKVRAFRICGHLCLAFASRARTMFPRVRLNPPTHSPSGGKALCVTFEPLPPGASQLSDCCQSWSLGQSAHVLGNHRYKINCSRAAALLPSPTDCGLG